MAIRINVGNYTLEISELPPQNMQNQKFLVALECSLESINNDQTTVISNVIQTQNNISCNDSFHYQYNITNPSTSIAYYQFSIDNNTLQPIVISTCHELSVINSTELYQPNTYLHLYKNYKLIAKNDNNIKCNGGSILELDDDIINNNGVFHIAVGEHFPYNHGRFMISIQCGNNASIEQIQQNTVSDIGYLLDSEDIMLILLLILLIPCLCTISIFGTWCYVTWKFKQTLKKQESVTDPPSIPSNAASPNQNIFINFVAQSQIPSQVQVRSRHARINNDSNAMNMSDAAAMLPLKSDGGSSEITLNDMYSPAGNTLLVVTNSPNKHPNQQQQFPSMNLSFDSPQIMSKNVSENTKYL